MCYVIINFGFTRYIVDVIAATYQKGVFAMIQFIHSGDASCPVEIRKAAYSCPCRIVCVKCFHSHAIAFLMFHTGFLSFSRLLYIGYDVFDVVGCTVFAVPVIAYPQVGFIVGVETFVEIFQSAQKPVEIPVFHFNRDVEVLPFGRLLLKIEHHAIFVLRCRYLPAQSCGYCDNLFCCCHRFVFLFPFVPSFSACRRVGFYVRSRRRKQEPRTRNRR